VTGDESPRTSRGLDLLPLSAASEARTSTDDSSAPTATIRAIIEAKVEPEVDVEPEADAIETVRRAWLTPSRPLPVDSDPTWSNDPSGEQIA
jgi:hypothetical protein